MSQKDKAKELEAASKEEAKKLMDLLSNQAEHNKLREEHKFTLEFLKKDFNITIQDCISTQKHAKILYEQGKYKGKSSTPFCTYNLLRL